VEKANLDEKKHLHAQLAEAVDLGKKRQEEATRLAMQLQVALGQHEGAQAEAEKLGQEVHGLVQTLAEKEGDKVAAERKAAYYKADRGVLSKQLEEANGKLAMAASALQAAAGQSTELKEMEQRLRQLQAEREMERVRSASLTAQLEQVSGSFPRAGQRLRRCLS